MEEGEIRGAQYGSVLRRALDVSLRNQRFGISVSCLVHLCTHWRLGQALEVREWCLGLERVGGVVDFFSPTVGKNRFCYVGSFMIFCPNSRFFNPGVPDEDKPLQEREREGERRPVFHGS